MPGNITFASDSAELNPSFYNVLNSVNIVLKQYERHWSRWPAHRQHGCLRVQPETVRTPREFGCPVLEGQGLRNDRVITVVRVRLIRSRRTILLKADRQIGASSSP